jgi:tetratricopeptide (TPR) repeat protein
MSRAILPFFSLLFAVCLACPLPLASAQARSDIHSREKSLAQAVQFAKAHRYAEAATAIRHVPPPEDRNQRIGFFRLRASIESGLGHSVAAAADIEAASKLAPDNLDLKVASSLARLEADLESHKDAAPILATLRELPLTPPQQLEVDLRTGEMLIRANLFAEAAKQFEEASRLAPKRSDIHFDLALARYRSGEFDSALASAEHARSLEDSGSVESLLGDIQEKRGDALAAARSYQAAVALEPNVEEHRLTLATELLKHQTFDAAIVVLEQAQNLFPQSVRVRVLLALTYYFVDRSKDSIHTLLEAARLDTTDTLATRYLGEITLQDSATPDPAAVTQVCAFADTNPTGKTMNSLCGGVLLRIAEDSGDLSRRPEILRRLRQAVLAAPRDPISACQLGKALEWSQQWKEARMQMEKCVRLDPDSPENHYRLARIYRRLGLVTLSSEQTAAQERAVKTQNEENNRHTNAITRFLVRLNQ